MPLIFNLRHLERQDVHLSGELPAEELDLADVDEMIDVPGGIGYDLVVERLGAGVLVQGNLTCTLACHCVRCLRPFSRTLELEPWACDLPLEGEEKVLVTNDCVDLTPYLREDILLAFPQHPLCEPGCRGLLAPDDNLKEQARLGVQTSGDSSAWAELNKLKF